MTRVHARATGKSVESAARRAFNMRICFVHAPLPCRGHALRREGIFRINQSSGAINLRAGVEEPKLSDTKPPVAVVAADVAPRTRPSNYPAPFSQRVAGRIKHVLGDVFGLKEIGINLTRLAPGAQSALYHRHSAQEEFIYILSGFPVLVTDAGETALRPGMCAGFVPEGSAHHLINATDGEVCYLEIGTRVSTDTAQYPRDDLLAQAAGDGKWTFTHRDGTPYPV
jgi:uncharacterized cupin superfamily protein